MFHPNQCTELFHLLSLYSEEEMLKQVSDSLLSDVLSPDLVHPTKEWVDKFNEIMFDFSSELFGKNNPDLWENVAKLFPGMTEQQVQEKFACRLSVNMPMKKEKTSKTNGIWSEDKIRLFMKGLHKYGWGKWKNISIEINATSPEQVPSFAVRMLRALFSKKDIQSLLSGEPQENGPIPAYRKRKYQVQVLDKNEEKEKTSGNTRLWSAYEKWLFLCGLLDCGWGKWMAISSKFSIRSTEKVRSFSRRLMGDLLREQDNQSLPPETNRPIANPGDLPFQRTVVYVPVPIMQPRASNMPPPIWRDLPSLRPEHGLDDIYGNFGGSVCYPSWNLRAETGANPSSRISDQVWNSTNTLSSDSYGCLPGPSAYGNNMNPGQ